MSKNFSLILLIIFGFCLVSAQNPAAKSSFELKATIKDQDKSPLPGMSLFIEGNNFKQTVVSDENGLFSVKLPVGKFNIKGHPAVSRDFLTFIEVSEDKPNPTDFDLIVETDQACCSSTSDGKPTEIIKYLFPPYPAAARATATRGEVVIAVKIDKDGKVISTKAETGHPLLRGASESAAKQFLFTKDENSPERDGKIIFAFVITGKEKNNIFRKPNRLEIFSAAAILQTTNH